MENMPLLGWLFRYDSTENVQKLLTVTIEIM
ncbi:hypothetical protein KKA17_08125 [bacterium]|nr:hypothetical protein [bacterium]